MIERIIKQLHEVGIKEIYVIVGFMKEKYEYLIDEYGVELVVNADYAAKNNLHSIKLAKEHLENAYIIAIIVPPPLIRRKNSNRVEYNVHFSSYVGTFSIFPFIFRQKEKSHRPSDQ